ncbi:tetratricopeptide repeat protein [Limnoglobus roseus]|uniref:Serine/threonine protein kinase n=1 Tax=Limnoglobus roseus TaxID=2598579 RepID=A0A5C1A6T3_9BACT|nr:tetratricopeptide repeat protein [Limnoglobus roseus]QEL14470.1 serine/threonine protein kinase [Limnoglobus roseus]
MSEFEASGTQAATPDQNKRSAEISATPNTGPPAVGDRYDVQDLIAEGGMGAVYRAADTALMRDVAVKVMHERYNDSLHARRRFEYEARITAQLQHPNIPPVHDLGTASNGCPFLALKLVKGQTLDVLLKARTDTAQDRGRFVAAFEAICQAIGYAHSKGVIHRDLKPLNVMVGAFGEVQVMDWGLAKFHGDATDDTAETTVATTFHDPGMSDDSKTSAGSILGTPAFMPPEQAIGAVDQIGEQSDVFGLGAILCVILTGQPPFVGGSGESTRQLAAQGKVGDAFARLDRCGADPELVALAKRCLAVDPAERLLNGSAVAAEVARIRAEADQRAVQAEIARASANTRRRVLTISACVVIGVLTAGIAATVWQAVRATNAEAATAGQLALTNQAKELAEGETAKALAATAAEKLANELTGKRLKQIEKNNAVILSIFEDLDPLAIKQKTKPLEAVLAGRLVKAGQELDAEAVGDPVTVADLQNRLGQTLVSLGFPKDAEPLFTKALDTRVRLLGIQHADAVTSRNNLSGVYGVTGRLEKATRLWTDLIQAKKANPADDHDPEAVTRLLGTIVTLASSAGAGGVPSEQLIPISEELVRVAKRELGPDDPQTLAFLNQLGELYAEAGQGEKAVTLLKEVLATREQKAGHDHPTTLTSVYTLAEAYQAANQADKAFPLYERALSQRRVKLGNEHPDTLTSIQGLAEWYRTANQAAKAVPLNEELVKVRKAKKGASDFDTLVAMNNLALSYANAGEVRKAIPIYQETLALMQKHLEPSHDSTLITMYNLADAHYQTQQGNEAARLFEEVVAARKIKLGRDDPMTLQTMNWLAMSYKLAGRLDDAIQLFEETLTLRKTKLGPKHPDTLISMNNLGWALATRGDRDRAIAIFEDAARLMKSELGDDNVETLNTLTNLADNFRATRRYQPALAVYTDVLRRKRDKFGGTNLATLDAIIWTYIDAEEGGDRLDLFDEYVRLHREAAPPHDPAFASILGQASLHLLKFKQFAVAEKYLRECLAIREKVLPDAWNIFATRSMIGISLMGQKKPAEAEPFLVAGYTGLRERESTIPLPGRNRLFEAGQALADLYAATDRPQKAADVRATLPNELAPWPREGK